MSLNDSDRTTIASAFAPLSLDALNAKAAMLERLDNKYVVSGAMLLEATGEFLQLFDVLEIEGKRSFGYDTWYFDDDALSSYYDHLQGRRRRMKVRVRRYLDARLCYVEAKFKTKRSITVKKRLAIPYEQYGHLDESGYSHVKASFQKLYGGDFDKALSPALEVYYERMTLVAKEGGERMTIDNKLRFATPSGSRAIQDDLYVVETKSANGNGVADKILRKLHQHPTGACSKYCIGMIATGAVTRRHKFLPALKKLSACDGI